MVKNDGVRIFRLNSAYDDRHIYKVAMSRGFLEGCTLFERSIQGIEIDFSQVISDKFLENKICEYEHFS